MSLTTTVFCKTARSTSPVPHCWGSNRKKKFLAPLAKLQSVLGIEPDICPKAERVYYPNDLSCCFIIRDVDGRSAAIFLFGTGQPPGLFFFFFLAKNIRPYLGELMFRLLNNQLTISLLQGRSWALFLNLASVVFRLGDFSSVSFEGRAANWWSRLTPGSLGESCL